MAMFVGVARVSRNTGPNRGFQVVTKRMPLSLIKIQGRSHCAKENSRTMYVSHEDHWRGRTGRIAPEVALRNVSDLRRSLKFASSLAKKE